MSKNEMLDLMGKGGRRMWFGALAALGLLVFVLACATVAEPPTGAFKADLEFPPPGTKWVYRTVDHTGTTTTATYTVIEEGIYEGKPAFRVSDGVNLLIYDKVTRNWVATLREGKERFSASPNNGAFSSPLWVGKSWIARYSYNDRVRGRTFNIIEYWWKVEAYEDVKVPAGTFKAFRLEGSNPYASTTLWYAPEAKLIIKRVFERASTSYLGYGKFTTELLEYPAK